MPHTTHLPTMETVRTEVPDCSPRDRVRDRSTRRQMPSHRLPTIRAARLIGFIAARGLVPALLAGTVLTPAAAQILVGVGSASCETAYVVESGDTLSLISERAYGDPQLYGFIADANWDALGGSPENIAVGMSLTIPCVDASGRILTPEEAAEAAASLEAAVATEGVLTPDQLDALFGPVALFPDALLTPVLVAVTFPLDVVKAGRFVEAVDDASDEERTDQAAEQDWDDSVKELAAAFPDVVTRMNDHIEWTEQAGEAVVAQTDDVLDSIQRLRTMAQENGYLVDNEAQTVETQGDTIVISSASPGVVYVPTYDPQIVYTTPIFGPPIYHYGYDYHDHDDWDGWGDALIAGGIILGGAIILDEIFDDDDWDGWDIDDDIDWDRGDITIDRGDIDIDRGDINIDRGDINIDGGDRGDISIGGGDRGDISIGDGDRQIGGGDRVSIGDSDRPQVDRGDLADRVAAGEGPRAGTLAANRVPISNTASREVARQKIEARQSTGAGPANLQTSRPAGGVARASNLQPSRLESARPAAAHSRAVVQDRAATRAAPVSRPTAQRAPTARAPSRSTAFQKPSGGHRAAASASRGSRSMGGGGRGGGGRGGGGRGR